jgi:hypothetical protein
MDEPRTINLDSTFEESVLAYLRGLADPCSPPLGSGSFLLLYASRSEVVVWFEPAHDQRRPGEVLIPSAILANAWEQLYVSRKLDLPALGRIAGGTSGAHWLLALLSLLPGVSFSREPPAVFCAPEGESTVTALA